MPCHPGAKPLPVCVSVRVCVRKWVRAWSVRGCECVLMGVRVIGCVCGHGCVNAREKEGEFDKEERLL